MRRECMPFCSSFAGSKVHLPYLQLCPFSLYHPRALPFQVPSVARLTQILPHVTVFLPIICIFHLKFHYQVQNRLIFLFLLQRLSRQRPVLPQVLQSDNVCFFQDAWKVPLLLHLKMTFYFPLNASFPISRCSILSPYSFFVDKRLYNSFASVTERCFPPVQPIEITN